MKKAMMILLVLFLVVGSVIIIGKKESNLPELSIATIKKIKAL